MFARTPAPRAVRFALLTVAGALLLSACQGVAGPGAASTEEPTPSPAASTQPSVSATPEATIEDPAVRGNDIVVPAACESIYSADMLATLNAANPPLNDPNVTMTPTQNVDALEVLAADIPTLRCSWGVPSDYGLATNVSTVTPEQSARVLESLKTSGFSCADYSGGTVCRFSQDTIDQSEMQVSLGETHYLRGNGWVSTSWINFAPDGYTEDIVASVWS